jgi:hypothetical protein
MCQHDFIVTCQRYQDVAIYSSSAQVLVEVLQPFMPLD